MSKCGLDVKYKQIGAYYYTTWKECNAAGIKCADFRGWLS